MRPLPLGTFLFAAAACVFVAHAKASNSVRFSQVFSGGGSMQFTPAYHRRPTLTVSRSPLHLDPSST
jgi:hypothetical protein